MISDVEKLSSQPKQLRVSVFSSPQPLTLTF